MGSHLAEALLRRGDTVRIFDRPNLRLPESLSGARWLSRIEGDFINKDDLANAVPGCDIIFHLVSTTLPKSSNDNPIYDVDTNVIGTLQLLEVARRSGVRKIVFISSGGTVYGIPRQLPVPESHSTDPLVSYGISKLAIEKYLHLYKGLHGLAYTILRVANPFGERQRVNAAQGAVAVFLHKALGGETIEIWGDGSVTRDYVYIQDVVDAFLKAMDYEGEPRVFNVGSGEGRSLNQVLETIEDLLGHPVKRRYLPARKFDVPVNVLDISRARQALGWEPRFSFREGLGRTIEWIQRDAQP
jgi:UDP-glucose 4-epimerase